MNVRHRMRDDVGESPDWDVQVAKVRQAQLDSAEGMPWVGQRTVRLEVGEK